MKLLNIILLALVITVCSGYAYTHGVNVGTVRTEQMIATPLYQCIKLLGGEMRQGK